MLVVRVLAAVAGAVLVVVAVMSAVKTVVLPRSAGSMITRAVFFLLRRFVYFVIGKRSFAVRDRVLAYYGPVALMLLPVMWVTLSGAGFTAIYWGTGMRSLRQSFLVSGSSILTLGTAFDHALPHAALSFAEALLGLTLVALLISYLPTIYGAFSRREQLVALLEVRAGLPPSPSELLARYTRIGGIDLIASDLLPRWEEWFADIEETHTTLPALVFFRSPHVERSWITSAGCVLDTAALVASTVDTPRNPATDVTIRSGFMALRRIADTFGIEHPAAPSASDRISVTRDEFDDVCAELEAAGVPLKADRDVAWADFAGWRVNYDAVLVSLATLVDAPRAQWSSDRGPLHEPRPKVLRRLASHVKGRRAAS